MRIRNSSAKRGRMIALAALLLYLTLGALLSMTKTPYGDEGYCAAPPYLLITRGYMGLPAFPEFGLQRHVYSQPPMYFLAQAAWYRVVGLNVFTMRFSNVLWGLVLLASLYAGLVSVTGERGLALLAAALLGLDYTFLGSATYGRADMMASALGAAAVAMYLRWRVERLGWAVLVSHALVALSGLTHPVGGILWELGLLAVTFGYDARRVLSLRYLVLGALPYLAGAAGWGLYILEDPADFKLQFLGIALSMDRGRALHSPIDTLVREFTQRYWGYYGPSAAAPGVSALRIFLPLGYLAGIACALAVPSLRSRPVVRRLAALFGLFALGLALIDGTKQLQYLIHLIPLAVALLAAVLWYLRASWVVVVALIVVQVGPVLYRARQNTYGRVFLPAVEVLRPYFADRRLVMADEQFGIPFDFPDNQLSDIHYGYRSGRRPDVIQIDQTVFDKNMPDLEAKDPSEGQYLRKLVNVDFREIWQSGTYRIYVRR